MFINNKRISSYYVMLVLRVSHLTQSFSQLNKIYKRINYNMVVPINLTSLFKGNELDIVIQLNTKAVHY